MTDDQTLEQMRVLPQVNAFYEENGATFDNFVASYPLCCPSRATFLTGQYALHHGVLGNSAPRGGYQALDHTNTLPVWLQAAGYRTSHVGKYLNGYPTNDVPPGWTDWQGVSPPTYYDYKVNDNGTLVTYGSDPDDYQTDVLADRAVQTITESIALGDPFFTYIAPFAPHSVQATPPLPAPRHEGMFSTESMPRGPGFNEADVSDKPVYIQGSPLLTATEIDALEADYRAGLAALQAVDELFGRVVDTLSTGGVLDNTVVMFLSDNGKQRGEHRQQGKEVPYEESIRVPLMAAGPGFPAGVHVAEQTVNADVAPTIVAMASATAGRVMDGIDLRTLVAAPGDYQDREVLIERYDANCFEGVRTPTHSYIRYSTGEEELYDLVADPAQLQSLDADQSAAAVKADLSARLDVLIAEGIEPCETPAPAVRVGDATVTESRQGSVSVSVPLTMNIKSQAMTVNYTLQPGSAASGDFVASSGSVSVKKGRLVSSIPVTVNSDTAAEADETFQVLITSVAPSIEIERAAGTVTIRNAASTAVPSLTVGNVSAVEGDDPVVETRDFVYLTLSLSKRLSTPLVVNYATADGAALAGSDYRSAAGTVTIPARASSVQVPLVILNDRSDEGDQTFSVTISTASSLVTVGPSVGTVTIIDNETE